MSPAPNSPNSRVVSTGLLAAGLFAAVLGAGGASAKQDEDAADQPNAAALLAEATPTPTPTPEPTPDPTPEPTPEAAPEPKPEPAAATEAAPPAEATPAPAETPVPEAGATPEADAEPTPEPTPEATPEATPEPTPDATREPKAESSEPPAAAAAAPAPAATPVPSPTPGAVDVEPGAGEVAPPPCGTGQVIEAEAGIAGTQPTKLTSGFPAAASTAPEDCAPDEHGHDHDHDGDKPRTRPGRGQGKGRVAPVKPGASKPSTPSTPNVPVPPVRDDGTPTIANPGYSLAQPGPARIGVPNFFIEKFRIPPFLLPIYQAAGIQYGVRWEILAAINEIETDYGRNLNVSSAGALGWMQFMPATWAAYGVDANKDGLKDPYNPVDAIFASARYLRAAGYSEDVRKAVFAYNHANWYVDSVLMRARLISGLPTDFVGSLTGLTQGRFPVHAKSTYAGELKDGRKTKKVKDGNAAYIVQSAAGRRGIDVFAKKGSPVVAVNDGKIVKIGTSERLGRFVTLQDVYGNTYTYAHLGEVAETYPAPKERKISKAAVDRELDLPRDAKPTAPASAGRRKGRAAKQVLTATRRPRRPAPRPAADPLAAGVSKERLFAHPSRPNARAAGGDRQLTAADIDYRPASDDLVRFDPKHFVAKPLRKGARVISGTILGRVGAGTPRTASHLHFEIRPAGRGAPRIDPKPILDGWKLLESTAIYRAQGKNPFFGADAANPSIGQILLMGKEALERRVLDNPRIDIYSCGRQDIRSGIIDRRVLATLEYLAASGLRPTVSSMRCGHGYYTASGNVSQHSTGDAVDIAAINGVPIIGHQGKGSVTEHAIQRLLSLQGTMKPDQIISLMTFDGADNTIAMGDHDDHIHVGWRPLYGRDPKSAKHAATVLKPKQWIKLIDRLGQIDNPEVELEPSKYAVKVVKKPVR